jgi:hypothetical protein
VLRLYTQAQQYAPQASFLCLTDLGAQVAALGVPAMSLEHDWPSWWAKCCAYALPGPNLQLDLDVSLLQDLTPILEACAAHDLIILRDFNGRYDWVDSSVVGWRGSLDKLTRRFAEAPDAWMAKYSVTPPYLQNRFGDQAFVADQWYGPITYWQDALPFQILSYKKQWRLGAKNEVPARLKAKCRIVVYHSGEPWDVGR